MFVAVYVVYVAVFDKVYMLQCFNVLQCLNVLQCFDVFCSDVLVRRNTHTHLVARNE